MKTRTSPPLLAARLALATVALLLAGCSLLGSQQRDPVTIYAPMVRIAPGPDWPSVRWQLALATPTAARVVDSPRINVRPTPDELQVYRNVAWSQPATGLLETSVLRALEDSGRIAAVARLETGIRADYKLAMDVRRFESDYAGQPVPTATIEVNAKLLDARDQRVVAAHTFLQRQPATAADTAQVANAFEQALTAITRDIAGWTLASGQADASQSRGR